MSKAVFLFVELGILSLVLLAISVAIKFCSKSPCPLVTTQDVVISAWPNVSPKQLLVFRGLYFLVCTGIIVAQFAMRTPQLMLIFFTTWNYLLQIAYFGVVAWIGVNNSSMMQQRQSVGQPREMMSRMAQDATVSPTLPLHDDAPQASNSIEHAKTTPLNKLVQVVGFVNAACVLVVAVITWLVLLPGSKDKKYLLDVFSFFEHAINVFAVMAEVWLSNIHLDGRHTIFVLTWTLVYGLFAFVYQVCDGLSPYDILDIEKKGTAVWLVALLFLISFFCLVAWGVEKFKWRRVRVALGVA